MQTVLRRTFIISSLLFLVLCLSPGRIDVYASTTETDHDGGDIIVNPQIIINDNNQIDVAIGIGIGVGVGTATDINGGGTNFQSADGIGVASGIAVTGGDGSAAAGGSGSGAGAADNGAVANGNGAGVAVAGEPLEHHRQLGVRRARGARVVGGRSRRRAVCLGAPAPGRTHATPRAR